MCVIDSPCSSEKQEHFRNQLSSLLCRESPLPQRSRIPSMVLYHLLYQLSTLSPVNGKQNSHRSYGWGVAIFWTVGSQCNLLWQGRDVSCNLVLSTLQLLQQTCYSYWNFDFTACNENVTIVLLVLEWIRQLYSQKGLNWIPGKFCVFGFNWRHTLPASAQPSNTALSSVTGFNSLTWPECIK